MTYPVILSRLTDNDLEEAYLWAARNAPFTAAQWLERFRTALADLATNPDRFPLAAESGKGGLVIRQMLFGRRPYVFRTLFIVEASRVWVLRIRRAQRRFLTLKQIKEAREPDKTEPGDTQ